MSSTVRTAKHAASGLADVLQERSPCLGREAVQRVVQLLSLMGNRRRQRTAFFEANPWCCFCGGSARAVEEDHIPARAMFRRRAWPVGYVFPSCVPCNRASALDELAMAWLTRITIRDLDAEDEAEMERCLMQLHDRQPSWVAGMQELSRTETRQYLRERGLSFESFSGMDLGIVTLPPELIAVPERYGVKLGKALYYLHTGRVLPVQGAVRVRVFPNTDYMAASFPIKRFAILTSLPVLTRSGKSLEDQFFYRYATVTEGGGAAFAVQFGESTALLLMVVEDAAAYAARRANRLQGDERSLSRGRLR